MGKYQELTGDNFSKVTESGVSFVDFWAPWCGPCRMIAPIIEELADDFEFKANICKVNTDEEQDLAVKHSVRSIPTILIMKDGEVVETIIGAKSKEEFASSIQKHLN